MLLFVVFGTHVGILTVAMILCRVQRRGGEITPDHTNETVGAKSLEAKPLGVGLRVNVRGES